MSFGPRRQVAKATAAPATSAVGGPAEFPATGVSKRRLVGNGRPMAGKRTSGGGGMTKAHKEALATGRNESRAVRRYLEALASTKPRRGRRRTIGSVQKRLALIEAAMETADRITMLKLSQERLD